MVIPRTVLVPTDCGEGAEAALDYGRELARMFHAALHVLHIGSDRPSTRVMPAIFGGEPCPTPAAHEPDTSGLRLAAAGGVEIIDATITSVNPARAVLDYAAEHGIELIVIGLQDANAMAPALRSTVVEKVVREARCPVLCVRADPAARPDAMRWPDGADATPSPA
jgi:nucleotide-binding universal stress UspA family protein